MYVFQELLKSYLAKYQNEMSFSKDILTQIDAIKRFYLAYSLSAQLLEMDVKKILIERTKIFHAFLWGGDKADLYLAKLRKLIIDDTELVHKALGTISKEVDLSRAEFANIVAIRYYDDCVAGED